MSRLYWWLSSCSNCSSSWRRTSLLGGFLQFPSKLLNSLGRFLQDLLVPYMCSSECTWFTLIKSMHVRTQLARLAKQKMRRSLIYLYILYYIILYYIRQKYKVQITSSKFGPNCQDYQRRRSVLRICVCITVYMSTCPCNVQASQLVENGYRLGSLDKHIVCTYDIICPLARYSSQSREA